MRQKISTCSLTALAALAACCLLAGPAAALDPMDPDDDQTATVMPVRLVAADRAGWAVFPGKSEAKAEDYAGGPVRLRNALAPAGPASPALDWLNRNWSFSVRSSR